MATAKLKTYAEVTLEGTKFTFGSDTTYDDVTIDNVETGVVNVAGSNGTAVIFDKGANGNIGAVTMLLVESAVAMQCEIVTSGANPNYLLISLPAGVPVSLPIATWYRDYGAIGGTAYTQWTSGTAADIDTVSVRNQTSSASTVKFLIGYDVP